MKLETMRKRIEEMSGCFTFYNALLLEEFGDMTDLQLEYLNNCWDVCGYPLFSYEFLDLLFEVVGMDDESIMLKMEEF